MSQRQRKYASGAQKRKNKEIQLAELKKLRGSLDKYYTNSSSTLSYTGIIFYLLNTLVHRTTYIHSFNKLLLTI